MKKKRCKTYLFGSAEEFYEYFAHNKDCNGVSLKFLNDYDITLEEYSNMNESNCECWNCWNCKECNTCEKSINCVNCEFCYECNSCKNCYGCETSENLENEKDFVNNKKFKYGCHTQEV